MALIIDPDNLSQGSTTAVSDMVFSSSAGFNTIIGSNALSELPAVAAGEFFEVRDHSDPENNGLYIATGVPTVDAINATKITGDQPVDNAVPEAATVYGTTGASTEKSIHFDRTARGIYILEQGNVDAGGVTEQCVYSFVKEEWKNDDSLNAYDFPMVSITPEQFEFVQDWGPVDNGTYSIRTRKLIRAGGWSEIDATDVLLKQYAGIKTLGSFEDEVNDTAYYQLGDDPTDTSATTAFTFAGPVDEAVLVYDLNLPTSTLGYDFLDGGGGNDNIVSLDGEDFASLGYRIGGQIKVIGATTPANDGTFTILAFSTTSSPNDTIEVATASLTADTSDLTAQLAVDNRNKFNIFIRVRDADPNGKTFGQSDLVAIGKSTLANQLFQFPLSNATDLNVAETDANIASASPYTQILVRYFDQAFAKDIDLVGTPRNFGIVVDVGTFSGVDGVTAGGSALTTAEAGIPGLYNGGTLTIHEGTDKGAWPITTTTAGQVNVTGTFSGSETDLSFTLQRATPITASTIEIYEKIQYLLRQAADIDSTDQTVTGKTADSLLAFVGSTLKAGTAFPNNPNGGGSGVTIMGFDANDTNSLVFVDNTAAERTYPFVAAGTIQHAGNLEADTQGWFIMFFDRTERFTNVGFGISAVTGPDATLDSSITDLTTELADNDYIRLSGFVEANNNGIFRVVGAPAGTGPWTVAIRKVNGDTLVAELAGASVNVDKNPIDSDDAIIVNDNSGSPIRGATSGSSSTGFDFDYDGNSQGDRTPGTNAAIIIRFGGYSTAQNSEISGTITQTVGLTFSLVSGLERNYSNP
jgi:hypothetical protein